MQPDGVKWRQMIGCCPQSREQAKGKMALVVSKFLSAGRELVGNRWFVGRYIMDGSCLGEWMNGSWMDRSWMDGWML